MAMTDPLEHRLRELAKSIRPELIDRGVGGDRECEICGVKELELEEYSTDARVEYYRFDCPAADCSETVSGIYFVVEAPPQIESPISDYERLACENPECECYGYAQTDFIPHAEPYRVDDYTIPVNNLIRVKIELHHISYERDETIPACTSCHTAIHQDNEALSEYKPVDTPPQQ